MLEVVAPRRVSNGWVPEPAVQDKNPVRYQGGNDTNPESRAGVATDKVFQLMDGGFKSPSTRMWRLPARWTAFFRVQFSLFNVASSADGGR